ncbi:MAG TPA: TRAP transporter TatT component family protein [Pyrinomonadaceae bacterium]|nr:tetratricopeptide repeat protein [Acidobacteriota bacterium]HQZ95408.1 TRAP transporter TatT component family protein [Pyrinomonadaceae bacterium]
MKTLKFAFLLVIVITLCLQFGCTTTDAVEPTGPTVTPEIIASSLTRSEDLFKQREDVAKLRDAVNTLRKARDYKQRNFEVEWRFAKLNYFLGKQSTDEKESNTAFEEGRDAAKIASTLEPQKADGYFWYGATLGELSRKNMLTVGVKSLPDVRAAMEKVVELQPGYQNSSAYDVLGQIELETRMLGGKAEKAVELLEKALETEKDNMNIHLHLAEAYLAVKKDGEARKQLEKVLSMKHNPDFLIECREAVEKAKKLLATKF